MNHPKIGFVSLGCPKNAVDTEVMLKILSDAGYELTPEETEAGIIVINTCAFIQSAKEEAIAAILDAAWLKERASLKGIVVCGCLPQRYGEEILAELPEVDAVVGVGAIQNIAQAVVSVEEKIAEGGACTGKKYFDVPAPEAARLGGDRVLITPPYTAWLKVSEGCDNRCSYCAIPSIRGARRSRPIEDLIEEARGLAELGVRELCVVAQDTTDYGTDLYGACRLPELLRSLAELDFEWIRALYCYPERIDERFIEALASSPKLVKYVDMPIQHISGGVLARMNRRGGSAAVRSAVDRLRAALPGIVLRTTVMTGFPGETEADFEELLAFVREARFERLGAFAYSEEEGTPAVVFGQTVPPEEAERRRGLIMEAQAQINLEQNEAKLGSTLRILCEGYDRAAGVWYGRSAADAPEIDGKIYFTSAKKPREGGFIDVRVTGALDYDLTGEQV